MPARVDHEERRKRIAEALLRLADAQGLHAASMRAVAAEAGVSLRLVQYYFTTKRSLLLDALERLGARAQARMEAAIRALGPEPAPRAVVAAALTAVLPTDPESRRLARAYTAFYTLILVEPGLLADSAAQPAALEAFLAAQLSTAQRDGAIGPGADTGAAAAGLLAMANGLGQSVLGGQRTDREALAVLEYHLDALFAR